MSQRNNPTTTKMELDFNIKKSESQDLLSFANGRGLHDKLLLKSSKIGTTLQTERIPRSSVLDRLESFLPQMAQANNKLKRAMEQCPPGHFDIESVEESEKIIEMDVAVVELSGSDNDSEDSSQTGESDSDEVSELTEESLKLPSNSQRNRKVNIQVLENLEN
ncbi:uncharacterized protein C12orf45 homolog [Osmerus mordax]|uniref:uncharacterized protein C12orf45 homolog n=1 Tax=Osmerus mordax TaxID=8014 RepID=UPI00350F1FD0